MSDELVLKEVGLLRYVTCIVPERQLRLYGYVSRLAAEYPSHRILSFRDPRGRIMPRGRPHASWLRHVESSLMDTGMAEWCLLGNGQTDVEGVPSQDRHREALLRRMPSFLTLICITDCFKILA